MIYGIIALKESGYFPKIFKIIFLYKLGSFFDIFLLNLLRDNNRSTARCKSSKGLLILLVVILGAGAYDIEYEIGGILMSS